VVVITAGVDVQGDRLEAEVIGWGVGQESWSLQYHVIHGDPAQNKVWEDLDKVLGQTIPRADGGTLSVLAACVDTGGHHTQKVYEFCKRREHARVYAIKGASTAGKPLVSKFSKANKLRVKLFTLGTDTAKQMIYSRLKIHQPGPGYCHFPADYPEEYFQQLTAERIQTKFINGHPTRVWVMPKGKRNEALDCRVYGLAALHILNPNLDALRSESAGCIRANQTGTRTGIRWAAFLSRTRARRWKPALPMQWGKPSIRRWRKRNSLTPTLTRKSKMRP
jgi:phage terminase large subunit GpA-like protein